MRPSFDATGGVRGCLVAVVRLALVLALVGGCASPPEHRPEVARQLPPPLLAPLLPSGPFFVADPSAKVVPILRADAPNWRYANLDREGCMDEVARRKLPVETADAMPDVLAPVRLTGPLHGVTIRSVRKARSMYEVFDCRLVLALDDFAELVAAHGVTAIVHANAYRPRTELGCTRRYWGLQHCGALAVDVRAFERQDGTTLSVERDFHGRLGLGTCGSGVGPTPRTPGADELWSFVCGAAERALFNVELTPNYNAEHHNHLHLELTPDAGWMMVH